MKQLFFVAALLSLFFSACKNEPKKPLTTNEILDKFAKSPNINKSEKSFDVTLPEGWTRKDTMLRGVKFHLIAPPADVVAVTGTSVNILNESMQHMTYEEYLQKTEQTMKDYMPGYKKLGSGSFITTDAVKGTWFHYLAKRSNIPIEFKVYTLPVDGVAYIITAGTRKGNMEQFHATFDSIARSFRIKD